MQFHSGGIIPTLDEALSATSKMIASGYNVKISQLDRSILYTQDIKDRLGL
ncbi:hypothetical protein [Acinetobacter sp.]|uniref:hypothetical protein n=1 Tax=Acinetobacter sp. TaxID=472 RepID=UPI0031D335B7